MAEAKHIQAHKRDKHNKAQKKDLVTEESGLGEFPGSSNDTNSIANLRLVENRRKQYQGYLDQKENREREGEEEKTTTR
eukprot:1205454-Heterocapsa_arctica.AAC.1